MFNYIVGDSALKLSLGGFMYLPKLGISLHESVDI